MRKRKHSLNPYDCHPEWSEAESKDLCRQQGGRSLDFARDDTKKKRAFTLIELMVVTAIIGMVVAAIGACLAGGMRAWDAARTFNLVESDAAVALSIMERDLRNSLNFPQVGFQGAPSTMSFPRLVESAGGGGNAVRVSGVASSRAPGGVRKAGTVGYFLDQGRKGLMRKEWAFPSKAPSDKDAENILPNAAAADFEFYKASSEAGGTWQHEWHESTNLPSMVRINLSLENSGNKIRISRTVVLPIKKSSQAP